MCIRVVAAPNAFKGSLPAPEAAEAIKKGVLRAAAHSDVACVPVSDGGDGLTEVLVAGMGGTLVETTVSGPRGEPVTTHYGMVPRKKLAVVEMAKASGLALLPKNRQDPTRTTTYGTGELIRQALDQGAKHLIVGIGGSATCDGGIGMAAALGFRFLDRQGEEVEPVGGALSTIASIDRRQVDPRLPGLTIRVACDVTNPLTGPNGASFVYSPQKGATPEQVTDLDRGLTTLANVIRREMGVDLSQMPGAGAAGGLGGGLHAFLGGTLTPGIDLVMEAVELKEALKGADLVLTAEGRIDDQTRFNKAPAGVARLAKEAGIPCFALCGSVGQEIERLYDLGIEAIFSICNGPQSLSEAIENANALLADCAEQVVRVFLAGH